MSRVRVIWVVGRLVLIASCVLSACTSTGTKARGGGDGQTGDYVPDIAAIEREIGRQVDEKVSRGWDTTVVGSTVDCPSLDDWAVGDSITCDVEVADMGPGIAVIKVLTEDGKYSWYLTNE